jgi:DNA-binding response OmpR family regulator
VLTRADLLRDVWSIEFDPGTNVVDVHIGRLRRKLGREGSPLIHTVRGEGYRLALVAEAP